jgi:3-oxoacyl-[acyl-carrier protein] reductase
MLKGKIALITGASGGIGKTILDLFIKNHAKVICLVNKNSNFINKNKNIEFIKSDIRDYENLKNQIEKIFVKKKRLDILINNAGIASGSLIEMTSQKILKESFEVNFFAQIKLTQLVLKYLKKSKSSSIVNIGSIVNFVPERGTLAYGSSKAAFMHATKIMAKEFAAYKIRVNGISPNVTKTKMLKKMDVNSKNSLISKSYLNRECKPIEVAKTTMFLSSDNSSYINGQILRLDGGMDI